MSGSLNTFLDDGVPEVEPDAPVVAEPIVVEPIVDDKVVVEKPADKPADEETPIPGARVPVAALQAERQQRQDWKEKATRYEGELSALRPQLDEVKTLKAQLAELQAKLTAPPPAAPVPQVPDEPEVIPNPAEDPQGFLLWQENRQFDRRVQLSEQALRSNKNLTDIDANISAWKNAAATNPDLKVAARLQPDPVRWAYELGAKFISEQAQQTKLAAALQETGGDLDAYNAKLRQAWEAERAQPPRAPDVVLPQSLAGARNAGERTQTVEAATEFEDIFKRKAR